MDVQTPGGPGQHEYFLRDRDVADRLGIGRSTLLCWVKQKRFPKPTQLAGGRCTRWKASIIENWIEEQGKN